MKNFRSQFLTGCLILLPFFVTIQLILWIFQKVDTAILFWLPIQNYPFYFRGLGVLLAVAFIWLVGSLTHNYVGKWLVATVDHAIRRVTIIGGIYSSIKKFLETIISPKTDQFKGVVLVPFPREGVYSVGFRTGKPDSKLIQNIQEPVTHVFVPCTPNPTSGFYLLVPEKDLIPLDLSVQEAFKIVISMGLVHGSED